MLAPLYSVTDYLAAFQRLLPRGRIWHRGWGTVQAEDILTLLPQTVRLNQRAIDVLRETFPCTTDELLPEWEASLGLPDPCTGELDTIEARQAAVCAKFTARGGQTAEYFIRVAAAAGYTITIATFRPFYASEGRVGDRLFDEQWAFVWEVTVHGGGAIPEELVCLLNTLGPAHTVIIFVTAP
jgi:uncharacterized protein YmfQ (DUF2313 family)